MFRRTATFITVVLSSTLLFAAEVSAQTALNRAVVQTVRNSVQVLRQNQSPRAARVSDVLTPGNGVSTARGSFAELRFNDGSLGRLGERVVFWFSAGTRNFRLSNGTVLMLIPPGQGRTQIRTPNAAAGIQGSALFVRYIPETDTTIVGALTDSSITVFNRDGTQQQTLQGGQMAVAIGDRIDSIYDFDLNLFYETSELVRGLAPGEETNSGESADPAIAQVQAEMQTAIDQQSPLSADEAIETPNFVRRPAGAADPAPAELTEDTTNDTVQDSDLDQDDFSRGQPEVPVLERLDQVITDPRIDEEPEDPELPDRPNGGEPPDDGNHPGDGDGLPIDPPVIAPPIIEPPIIEPPIVEPPIVEPPTIEPPIVDPPVIEPPVIDPPVVEPPVIDPPVVEPPVVEPPVTEPPIVEPPVITPPSTDGPGNSDGIPGGGNENNSGNGNNGSTDGPGNSDGIPGGGNENNSDNGND